MKLKRSHLFLCLICIIMLGSIDTVAQAPQPRPRKVIGKHIVADKVHSRKAIRRTAFVINNARQKVKINKNYTGDLSRAVAHQRFARKLHMRGFYGRAIHHTRVARMFARKAIKANKGPDVAEANFTPEEEELMKNSPSEQELIEELAREDGKPVINDEGLANDAPDIDLGDND